MLRIAAALAVATMVMGAAPATKIDPITSHLPGRTLVQDNECYEQCLVTCLKMGGSGGGCHGACADQVCAFDGRREVIF